MFAIKQQTTKEASSDCGIALNAEKQKIKLFFYVTAKRRAISPHHNKMKAQTYRILEFEGEVKPGVDIPQVFEFLIFGSKGILKPPYKVIIHVNEFTGKVVYTECPCVDCQIKRNENCKNFAGKDYKCKHIKFCEGDLIEDKHLTPCIKSMNNEVSERTVEVAIADNLMRQGKLTPPVHNTNTPARSTTLCCQVPAKNETNAGDVQKTNNDKTCDCNSHILKSKNNSQHSQQGNPLSDKCISPDANIVETHQAADTYHNLKTTEDKDGLD